MLIHLKKNTSKAKVMTKITYMEVFTVLTSWCLLFCYEYIKYC